VAFSCKARAVCPSCLGRRMSAGALNLVDHVLPDLPLRQFVLTMPFPLRFPLAFDGKLLGQVVRIFADTVATWYQRRHVERGLPAGEFGAVTVIQRANSDLRLNPHLHTIFLDGVYSPDGDGKGQMFHPALAPTQQEIEALVARASKRILRFLQRRGVITLVIAPGDGEVTVVADETMGEKDPLLAKLLAAATAGAAPAGPVTRRQPIRIVLDPDDRPVAKGNLCAQDHAFNLHAATRVAANDKQGRLTLCRYILRPPLANHWLRIVDDSHVRVDFKKPWSDGTTSVDLDPLALIARLAALVPPPKRHTVRYFGVLSSHAASRSQVVPAPGETTPTPAEKDKPAGKSRYIPWAELLRKTFGFELLCSKCKGPLRLVALIKSEEVAKKILTAMHLPTEVPELHPARPPPGTAAVAGGEEGPGESWLN
jgi:Putative transposase